MADPVVHITNGIPDLGTGNITTLGMTLTDGANVTLGSTADVAIVAGAAGSINAHLRSISRDLVGGIVLQSGANLIGSVAQSGGWNINVSQFGGNAVVTGTGIGGVGVPRVTVSSDSSLAATQSGTWNITNITGSVPLPTGAATSAKQPALGTAGVPSADVISVQGIASGVAIKVDGTGGSFPVSGTVAATQSGTWNITNVSGTISLPSGAATAAKQPALGTAGAPSADVITVQGSAAMTALKTNILGNAGAALDFAGQNAAGTINAQLAGGQFNTSPTTITTGNFSPLQLDSTGNLCVNIKAGAGSGGTASTFGAAFPSTGTAIGVKNGANMVNLVADASGNLQVGVATALPAGSAVIGKVSIDQTTPGTTNLVAASQSGTWNIGSISGTISLPTGAATSTLQPSNASLGSSTTGQTGNLDLGAVTTSAPTYTTGTSNALSLTTAGALRVDGSGATQPVSGTFWQATQPVSGTVTVQQGTASSLQATVTGTVAATQSGTWITRMVGNSGAVLDFPGQNAASPANAVLAGGQFNTAPTTITSGNSSPLQLDNAGNLKVNIAVGGGAGGTSSNFGTTFPATGTAAGAEYLSVAPTLTSGQMVALQVTSTGSLHTTVDNSVAVTGTFWQTTQPVSGTVSATQSGTWTVQPGNTANTTPWLTTVKGLQDSGGTDMTDTVNHALKVNVVAGGAAGGGTSSSFGSAFPSSGTAAGAEYLSAPPTLTSGQMVALQVTSAGSLHTTVDNTVPVTGTFWQSTQPVSGTVTANQGGAPWTIKPDGTAWALSGTSANVNLTNASVAVTGTFWQATQPVSGTVTVTQGTAANLNATVSGTVAATQSGTWNITNLSGTVSLPTGAATSAAQPTNAALGSTTSGQTGNLALGAVTSAAPTYVTTQSNALSLTTAGALRVDGSGATQPVSGTFWQATQPVSGTFWQATQPVSIAAAVTVAQATAANLNATVTGTVSATQSGTWTVQPGNTANTTPWLMTLNQGGNSAAIKAASTAAVATDPALVVTLSPNTPPQLVQGDTASGATDAGNPVKVGGVARTSTLPTAVAAGQRVNAMYDVRGRAVAVGAQRETKGSQKTSITTASETTVVTAFASNFIDVYAIIITNKSATGVFVDFRYATGGTVVMTLAAPAGDTRGFTVPVDSAMTAATINANWTATVSSAVTSIEITMLYTLN